MTQGELTRPADRLLFAPSEESREWFELAGNTALAQQAQVEYIGLGERIAEFTKDMPQGMFAAERAARGQSIDTIREVLDPLLGDYPDIAGRAFWQLFEHGQQRVDLTECASLVAALEDPILARFLSRALDRPRIKGLINWKKVNMTGRGGVDYADPTGSLYDIAAMGPEYRLALSMRDSATREHNALVDRDKAALKVAESNLRDLGLDPRLRTISMGATVPERIFRSAMHERTIAETTAGQEEALTEPQQVGVSGIRRLLRRHR